MSRGRNCKTRLGIHRGLRRKFTLKWWLTHGIAPETQSFVAGRSGKRIESYSMALPNPKKHMEQATEKNEELDGHWVPLVKMAKGWNRANGKPIKPSFLVEVMAEGLVEAPFSNYPNEVRNLFAAMEANVGASWPDPAGLGPPVSDQMTPELVTAARKALQEAQRKAPTQCAPKRQDGREMRYASGAKCWGNTSRCHSGTSANPLNQLPRSWKESISIKAKACFTALESSPCYHPGFVRYSFDAAQ